MNAGTFEAWLVEHLLPSLEEGDTVVLDNLQAHKNPTVAEILARTGCKVNELPPYSPDLNPIEKAFAKLKALLRKLAERTVVGLIAALEGCAELFKPGECENDFESCGYDPQSSLLSTQPERIPLENAHSTPQNFQLKCRTGRELRNQAPMST